MFLYLINSPATVSRCGMVYMDPKNLGFVPFFNKWRLARDTKNEIEPLNRLFNKYVVPLIALVIDGFYENTYRPPLKMAIPVTGNNLNLKY